MKEDKVPKARQPRRAKKVKYTTASLPFPQNAKAQYHRLWCGAFKSTLVAYTSGDMDPFGTNATIDVSAVEVWNTVYPSLAHVVEPEEEGFEILAHTVKRSECGTSRATWQPNMVCPR
ncbi:hypothetical protein CPC08DRAFT_717856, partial [Agrocybe pediades]